jgi:NADPH-dependent glutamate synthase beta subunit-like oxidoreductase
MPANEMEIVAVEHEGVLFQFLAAPTRILGDDQNQVVGLEYLKNELGEPDASGRRRPVPIQGSETILNIDMLITAIGQRPDISFLEKEKNRQALTTTRWNTFDSNEKTMETSMPYIFTGGDCATGPALVVDAIGNGRRAARSIHQYLNGETVMESPKSLHKRHIPESLFQSVPGVVSKLRTPIPVLDIKERIHSMVQVEQVITEEQAQYESRRCLACCRLCYNPDENVKRNAA